MTIETAMTIIVILTVLLFVACILVAFLYGRYVPKGGIRLSPQSNIDTAAIADAINDRFYDMTAEIKSFMTDYLLEFRKHAEMEIEQRIAISTRELVERLQANRGDTP